MKPRPLSCLTPIGLNQTLLQKKMSANGCDNPSSLSENVHLTVSDSTSNATTQTPNLQLKCSVRACKRNIDPDSGTKMCEVCRGKHRIYATTKRARRKLEKAAVVGMRRMSERVETDAVVVPDSHVSEWISTQAGPSTILTTATWNSTPIDPQLFSESISASPSSQSTASVNTQSPMGFSPLHPPVSYIPRTNSELAGALTLPPGGTASVVNELKYTTSYYRHGTFMEPDRANANTCTVGWNGTKRSTCSSPKPDNQEEEQCSDGKENENNEGSQGSIITADSDNQSYDIATATQDTSSTSPVDGSTKFCSIKGCKAVIPGLSFVLSRLPHATNVVHFPASYAFKMCPSCRVRYRTYGITKRAKWKAEREAFDRELADLRYMEDERRKVAGERVCISLIDLLLDRLRIHAHIATF